MTKRHFQPELIVFDLDGTLVDSSPDLVIAVNRMLTTLKQTPHPEQQIKQWMGNGAEMLIKRALTGKQEPVNAPDNLAEAMDVFFNFYQENICVHSQLYAGVKEGLAQLQAANINLACVTNKPTQFTLPLLTDIGLKDYFQFIASGDTFNAMKPDPLPLTETAKIFATEAQKSLMVGDSINDILAGQRAGFKTALVPYGYIGKYTPAELNADYSITNISQLAELFCPRTLN
jgi:phosphoglycolate phosphatase